MKKALIVTTISGFLPQFEQNNVKILQENGYEVHYASNFDNPVYDFDQKDLKDRGIILHPIDISKKPHHVIKNTKAYYQIRKIIENEKIDLIHCHNPMGGVVARIAAAACKQDPTIIYTAHGFHFYSGAPLINWILYYTAEKLLAKRTDLLITINQEDYDRAQRFKLRRKDGLYTVHGVGVNMERFKSEEAIKNKMREKLNIPQDGFHIVTAAELNRNKNQEIMIRAIRELQHDNIYYSICGKGEMCSYLQKLIDECGLQEQVRLLGYRHDMEKVLNSADCFAFPSLREGLGIAAIEALACGVPVVALKNRGTREYMKDGYNGILCEHSEVKEFCEAIERLYHDKELRNRYAGNGRNSVRRFSIENVDLEMRQIYQNV